MQSYRDFTGMKETLTRRGARTAYKGTFRPVTLSFMSCRPLAEIAVEAMLRSRMPNDCNRINVEEWLGK